MNKLDIKELIERIKHAKLFYKDTKTIILEEISINFKKCIEDLYELLSNNKENKDIRSYSISLINMAVKHKKQDFEGLNKDLKDKIENISFSLLKNDYLRENSSNLIISLIKFSNEKNEWPDLLPTIIKFINSEPDKFKINLLNKIVEEIPETAFSILELKKIEHIIIGVLKYNNDMEISLVSIKAYYNFLNYSIFHMNIFRDIIYLHDILSLLIKFCHYKYDNNKIINDKCMQFAKYSIFSLSKIFKIAYFYISNYASKLLEIVGNLGKSQNEDLIIESFIFFIKIAEEEIKRKKSRPKIIIYKKKNYIQNNWKLIINFIENAIKNNDIDEQKNKLYRVISKLLYKFTQLLDENIIKIIYQDIAAKMNSENKKTIISSIFISSSLINTIHQKVVRVNVLQLSYFEFLIKFLNMDSSELHIIVTGYFKKICEIFSSDIICDTSLMIKTIEFIKKEKKENESRINICFSIYYLCKNLKSSNLEKIPLILYILLMKLDEYAYLPEQFVNNFPESFENNLAYYSFRCISLILEIPISKNLIGPLRQYLVKLLKRINDSINLSNFINRNGKNDKEKQYQYQNYLCMCLISYCKEGKNAGNLSPKLIYSIFNFIEKYFIIQNNIFENGLLSLSRLTLVYSNFEEKVENNLKEMIAKTLYYIFEAFKKNENISNIERALDCFIDIINSGKKFILFYMEDAAKYFDKLTKIENLNENILCKIIIIFIDLIKISNVVAWKYIEIGLICMEKLINYWKGNFSAVFYDSLNDKKFIQLNEILLLFIDDLTENAKNNRRDEYKKIISKYLENIFAYINKIFQNNKIRINDDILLFSLEIFYNLVDLFDNDAFKLIEKNALINLYNLVDEAKDNYLSSLKEEIIFKMSIPNKIC